jgi:hypothetical protein
MIGHLSTLAIQHEFRGEERENIEKKEKVVKSSQMHNC